MNHDKSIIETDMEDTYKGYLESPIGPNRKTLI